MKRILFIAVFLFYKLVLCAQKDSVFYRHELKTSVGDAAISNIWLQEGECNFNFYFEYQEFTIQ